MPDFNLWLQLETFFDQSVTDRQTDRLKRSDLCFMFGVLYAVGMLHEFIVRFPHLRT